MCTVLLDSDARPRARPAKACPGDGYPSISTREYYPSLALLEQDIARHVKLRGVLYARRMANYVNGEPISGRLTCRYHGCPAFIRVVKTRQGYHITSLGPPHSANCVRDQELAILLTGVSHSGAVNSLKEEYNVDNQVYSYPSTISNNIPEQVSINTSHTINTASSPIPTERKEETNEQTIIDDCFVTLPATDQLKDAQGTSDSPMNVQSREVPSNSNHHNINSISTSPIILDQEQQTTHNGDNFIQMAVEQAKLALIKGETPVGCVLLDKDGETLATGANKTNETRDPTQHAELIALESIIKSGGSPSDVDKLFVTIEPCIMCASALLQAGIPNVTFAAYNDKFGGMGGVTDLHNQEPCSNCNIQYIENPEVIELLRSFYSTGNPNAPNPKRVP